MLFQGGSPGIKLMGRYIPGGGNSHMKRLGMLVGKFEVNP